MVGRPLLLYQMEVLFASLKLFLYHWHSQWFYTTIKKPPAGGFSFALHFLPIFQTHTPKRGACKTRKQMV